MYTVADYQFPNVGEPISFPYVFTNKGDYYDPSESTFTCPLDGTYYFTFSLYSLYLDDGEFTMGAIQRDEEELSEAHCQNYGTESHSTQCGNSVVIQCNEGQRVFVTATHTDSQLHGYRKRSTFSGFLIHADVSPY